MKIQQLDIAEALASLHSGEHGLAREEARRRLAEFGHNEFETVAREPLWRRAARQFSHFFAVILWFAAALAFVAEARDPGQGMAMLGFAIAGVILINGLFSFWQEYRAERTAAALRRLLPHRVKALREDAVDEIPARELVPGDVILLEEGDVIAADCRLLRAAGLRVNTATLTGESASQAKDARPSGADDLLQCGNIVLAGTSVVAGNARAVVFATGNHAEFGRIAHLTQTTHKVRSPLQKEIVELGRIVAIIATVLGTVFFAIGLWLGLPFWQNFIFAIGIIVANVPEGLLPTFTLALAMGAQRMAKKNTLIRHLPSVETLGCATVICTDKTGTLTLNEMSVRELYIAGNTYTGDFSAAAQHRELFEAMSLCHSLKHNNHGAWLGDPMEIALAQTGHDVLGETPDWERLAEIPFDAQRMRYTSVHRTPRGTMVYTKGALETVLPLCGFIVTGAGVVPLDDAARERVLAAQQAFAQRGLRVLAFASRALPDGYDPNHSLPDPLGFASPPLPPEEGRGEEVRVPSGPAERGDEDQTTRIEQALTLLALTGLEDPPRPEVPAAIARCREAGIKVIMVTGDHPRTAEAVARAIGLVESPAPVILTGEQLHRMSNAQLQLALRAPEILFARVKPDQKRRIVHTLQRAGHVVAATGDGVNDAPALKQADIGIAMGKSGTDVAREAADMVLLDDNFASIVNAVEEGRAVYENIRKFLTYILSSNIPEIVPYLAFALFRIPLPLTVIQILAVDLGTDMMPALGLGAEKPRPGIMRQPPRPRHERLLNWPLFARAYLFLGMIEAAAAMTAYFFVLHQGGWHYGQPLDAHDPLYLQATTACLGAIVAMQIVNVFLCRGERDSAFARGYGFNPWIAGGIAVEIALLALIIHTPWGQALFGTAPLDIAVWLFIAPFALAFLLLEEGRKAIARWLTRRR